MKIITTMLESSMALGAHKKLISLLGNVILSVDYLTLFFLITLRYQIDLKRY